MKYLKGSKLSTGKAKILASGGKQSEKPKVSSTNK
jgi:hypothetical protein